MEKKEIAMLGFLSIVPLVGISFILFIITCWCVNVYKLTQCDFKAPYKTEIVHAAGLVPILAPFTVWVGTEDEK